MVDQNYTHILVPTNFKPSSQEAYRTALAIATSSRARVTLLHVLPKPDPTEYLGLDAIRLMHRAAGRSSSHLATAPENVEAVGKCHDRLREEIPADQAGVVHLSSEVRIGEVPQEIAQYANEAGADLIVMAGNRPRILPVFVRKPDQVAKLTPVPVVCVIPSIRTPETSPSSDD